MPSKKDKVQVKVLCSNCEKALVTVDQNVIEKDMKSDDKTEETEEMSDAEKKKRNQRREDISGESKMRLRPEQSQNSLVNKSVVENVG